MAKKSFCHRHPRDLEMVLERWFNQPLGQRIRRREQELLQDLSSGLFGYHLLQLGGFGRDLDHLAACPVKTKTIIGNVTDPVLGACLIRADKRHLPVASDSTDAVILPHTLDFSDEPQQVLREVERVLIPEGRVIITGFNPYSLWGLWRLSNNWRGQVPWCGQFLSRRRLEDWLSLLGFDVESAIGCEFFPPMNSAPEGEKWQKIDKIGRRYWPFLGSVYAVKAVKRVSRVRPITSPWRRLRAVRGRAVEPTTRLPGTLEFEPLEDQDLKKRSA